MLVLFPRPTDGKFSMPVQGEPFDYIESNSQLQVNRDCDHRYGLECADECSCGFVFSQAYIEHACRG